MDEIIGGLERAAENCDREAATLDAVLRPRWDRLRPVLEEAARAWSGSFAGYHSRIYIRNLRPAQPDEVFDPEWGTEEAFSNQTRGEWAVWDAQGLLDELWRRAGISVEDQQRLNAATSAAKAAFRACRDDVLPLVDALLALEDDAAARRAYAAMVQLKGENEDASVVARLMPSRVITRDSRAAFEGVQCPPHLQLQGKFTSRFAIKDDLEALARECRYLVKYLRSRSMARASVSALPSRSGSGDDQAPGTAVLFLAANPSSTNWLALDEEWRAIHVRIRSSEQRDRLRLVARWATRAEDLLDALNAERPTIIHFSGHGDVSGIALHDDAGGSRVVPNGALKRALKAAGGDVRLVLLNACFSLEQARALVEVVDCVIGMKASIDDESARVFAAAFYSALGFGKSIAEAYEQGLAAIDLAGLPDVEVPQLIVRTRVDASTVHVL